MAESNPRDPDAAYRAARRAYPGICPACGADRAEGWVCPECGHDPASGEAGTRTGRVRCSEPNLSSPPFDLSPEAVERDHAALMAEMDRLVANARTAFEGISYLRAGEWVPLIEGVEAMREAAAKRRGVGWVELSRATLGSLAERILNLRAGMEIACEHRDAALAELSRVDAALAVEGVETLPMSRETAIRTLRAADRAKSERIAQLEAAILDQGGEWVVDATAPTDTGVGKISVGTLRDPMHDIDARLRALTEGPPEASVAGVALVCPGRSPISGHPCDFTPRHTEWCCHVLPDGSKVRWSAGSVTNRTELRG